MLAGLVAAQRLRTLGGIVPIDFFAARYGERRVVRLWAWLSNIPSLLGIFAAQLMAAARCWPASASSTRRPCSSSAR